MSKRLIFISLAVMMMSFVFWAAAQERTAAPRPASTTAADHASSAVGKTVPAHSDAQERVEGEKRFKANCARCHMAPQKFPPRTIATIVRHMRVRATISDEDARLILKYMTQ